jgi:hypothetical protein
MAEGKNEAEWHGGEYMIQDRDHMGAAGQMGGEAGRGRSRQSEQSQAGSRQPGGRQDSESGQQGGERGYRRRKFL